jgi:hypothetical protein
MTVSGSRTPFSINRQEILGAGRKYNITVHLSLQYDKLTRLTLSREKVQTVAILLYRNIHKDIPGTPDAAKKENTAV